MNLQTLGQHILVEYYNCDSEILKDPILIEKIMIEAAKVSNATIVNSLFHHFSPWGVSGTVIISESHLAIHTWPEYKYAAVDFFTCGENIKPLKGFDLLEKKLKAAKSESFDVPRGIIEKVNKM